MCFGMRCPYENSYGDCTLSYRAILNAPDAACQREEDEDWEEELEEEELEEDEDED